MTEPDTYAMGDPIFQPGKALDLEKKKNYDEERWIDDDELATRMRIAENKVVVYILQLIHIAVSAIFCLGLFWGLFANSKSQSGPLLGCAISSTVSVTIMFMITAVLLGEVQTRLKVYRHVEAFTPQDGTLTCSKAYDFWLTHSPLSSTYTQCLARKRKERPSLFDAPWELDPHSMSLEWIRDYIKSAGDAFSFKKLVVIIFFLAYMAFYPLVGFYISLIMWTWKVIQKIQKLDLGYREDLL